LTDEQQRSWATERTRRNLTRGHERFAATGLMTCLDEPRLLVTVLAPDPLAPVIDFSEDLLDLVPERFAGHTANGIGFLGATAVTDDAVARVAEVGDTWRAYAGIRRTGTVEVGIGSTTRRQLDSPSEPNLFAYRLYYIVHAARVAIETQARLLTTPAWSGHSLSPFELVVALAETAGAFLGGRADGWEEPTKSSWGLSTCITPDILIRTQFDVWPATTGDQLDALVRVGDRVCNAFGTMQRLFAPPNGRPGAGRLSADYA
jgi:hypothetical protein